MVPVFFHYLNRLFSVFRLISMTKNSFEIYLQSSDNEIVYDSKRSVKQTTHNKFFWFGYSFRSRYTSEIQLQAYILT